MENIGWFEYAPGEDYAAKVQSVVEEHTLSTVTKQDNPATNEGGVDVADEVTTPEENVQTPEAGSAAPAVTPVAEEGQAQSEVDASNEAVADNAEVAADSVEESAPAEGEVEKAADVSEVEVEEPDFAKMFGDLQAAITKSLETSTEVTAGAITKVNETLDAKYSELSTKHDELTEKFNSVKAELDAVAKRVDSVEADTAVKKSGDLGGSTEDTLTKSKGTTGWNGHFLSTTDL